MEIYPHVYFIRQMFVNLYLLVGEDGLVLIDTGLKGSRARILRAIQEAKSTPADLKSILITHADGDHYGGLADLQQDTHAMAYANPIEAEAVRAGRSSRPLNPGGIQKVLFGLVAPLFKSQAGRIDAALAEGQEFGVLGGLKVIATPGHTPGHTSLFSPSSGVLFAGDSIQIVDGKPRPSGAGNTWNMARAEESYQMQMALKPLLILAGHGSWQARN
jgi:glyoxylase-like metal-dependent hydrolase (beta-lactamase superfamily II)